ncbi:MAG: glycosyltransferase, partial [Parvularcula sp.]|nr:glycosyltransferase [Parvularcula sp.]
MPTELAEATTPKRVRLAIAIPAYGRAQAIADSIWQLANQARSEDVNIAFYVSDDTFGTSVRDALQPLIDTGLPVIYRSNSPSLGHDRNLIATLLWPNADYVWLLGSAHTVKPGKLVKAYRFLEEQDLVFINRRFP